MGTPSMHNEYHWNRPQHWASKGELCTGRAVFLKAIEAAVVLEVQVWVHRQCITNTTGTDHSIGQAKVSSAQAVRYCVTSSPWLRCALYVDVSEDGGDFGNRMPGIQVNIITIIVYVCKPTYTYVHMYMYMY